jgi:hypothetical protein
VIKNDVVFKTDAFCTKMMVLTMEMKQKLSEEEHVKEILKCRGF